MKNRDRILAGTAMGVLMAVSTMAAHAGTDLRPSVDARARADAAAVVVAQASNDDQENKKDRAERRKERQDARGEKREQRQEKREQRQEKAQSDDSQAQPREKQEARPEPSAKPKPVAKQAEEKAEPRQRKAEPEQAKPRRAEKADEAQPRKQEAAKPDADRNVRKGDDGSRDAKKADDDRASEKKPERDRAERKELAPKPVARDRDADKKAEAKKDAADKADAMKADAKKADQKKADDRKNDDRKSADKDRNDKNRSDKDDKDRSDKAQSSRDAMQRIQQMDDARTGAGSAPNAVQKNADQDRNRDRNRDDRADGNKRQRANGDDAPMLDSQKDAEHRRGGGRDNDRVRGDDTRRDQARDRDGNGRNRDGDRRERAEGPPPKSDRAAQRDIKMSTRDMRKFDDQKGRRIDEKQWRDWHRRDGAEVVKRDGDRTLIEFNNQIIVQDRNHDRIRRHARDVYYEELPDQLRREVVVRPDGSKIITVRNGYGDIVRRTRVVPGGQEYVLVYSGGDSRDGWHDPAADLPPLQIDIPRSEYILESDDVRDSDRYYDFLEQPPVEQVQQLYTIDQVKYSSRVRDMVRRVDLDTINFATGSADISQNELPALEDIADAMQRMIEKNPAETFLIEGHTDAVGSDDSNLILSDKRAESVATALTDVYKVPPENLFTQGYGEQYLKVDTDAAERENRRVAIRRITPLVSPVASNE